jgi:hypothetical protein
VSAAARPPRDLRAKGRGRKFWQAIVDEFEPSSSELEMLAEACRTLDELDELRRSVAADGATVVGSRGQTRVHPALGELRQSRAELRRLLDALGIPAPAGEVPTAGGVISLASRRAQKAARARWGAAGGA